MAASLGQRASRPLRLCRDCHRWRNGGSRGAFLEALSLMRSITLPLVRARGRALQDCVRTAQGQSYRESIGVKPSGSGCLRARRMLSHWRGAPPKAPRQWRSRRIAHAPCANRFAVRAPVRAPKAEHWQSTRPSASKNLSALQKAPQKACALLSTFFNFFLPPPCAPLSLLLHLQPSAMGRAFRRGAGNPHSPSD